MARLESIPGAGLLVDREYTVTDGNARCEIVFKEEFDEIRGATLQRLHERGFFREKTLTQWKRAVTTVLDGEETERSEQIRLTPPGTDEAYVYDLTTTAVSDQPNDQVCCSLRSVGTRQHYDETITALHVATRELMTADDTEEVLQRTAVAANEVLGFPGTAVRKYDERDRMLRHVAFGARVENLDTRPPYHVDDSPHGRAIRRGDTVIDDIGGDDPYDRDPFTQTMYIPIGKAGLLSVGTVGNTFDETDVQFAEILAENAAAAIRVVDTTTSLRQERERLELLRQILTRVLRHNIRNDMNVIKGHAEILDNRVDEDERDFIENIIASVENVTTLSEKAREIERIIEKSHSRRRLDVDASIDRTRDRIEQQYPDSTIRTDVDGSYEVWAHTSLDIALTNLVENAYEHTGTDDPTVLVSVTATEDTVEIRVRDNGPGIPDAEIEVLDAMSETKLEHGSGLGLWVVNWVVEQSDGTLTFDTSDGTCVEITLDRARENAP